MTDVVTHTVRNNIFIEQYQLRSIPHLCYIIVALLVVEVTIIADYSIKRHDKDSKDGCCPFLYRFTETKFTCELNNQD